MNAFSMLDSAAALLPFSDSALYLGALGTLTHMGDARAVTIVGLAMATVLWRRGMHSYWIGLGVSVLGALASSWTLKLLIERPRPLDALIDVGGYSFPSMHAAVAAALYGYLIYATLRLLRPPHHRIPWAVLLFTLLLLVGLSRVYLHVHYLSDIVAGFALGALWVFLGTFVEQRLHLTRRER